MESEPQNPEFSNNPENFDPCNPCILETPKGVPGALSDNPDKI